MFDVGFGDCFLLTFHYSTTKKHLLIDFGTTRQSKDYMKAVAREIANRCSGKLDAVVATHRHRDHLSGFQTDQSGESSGEIIAGLKPSLVSMTWTEDPELESDATGPIDANEDEHRLFVRSLASMQRIAERAKLAAKQAKKKKRYSISSELEDLAEINISNKSALVNLLNMHQPDGEIEFLHYGKHSKLNQVFRGVKFHVLGPPTVDQSKQVKRQRAKDKDEYWHLANYWRLIEKSLASESTSSPFSKKYRKSVPSSAKWLVDKMKDPSAAELLRITRVMDRAINNSSIILLIELHGTKLLFPGDAQIESWEYVLNGPESQRNRELLADCYVYKVGHHGSLNGTPKSLWNLLDRRRDVGGSGDLTCLLSSRIGVHGKAQNGTEVPRNKLVQAIKAGSDLLTTDYGSKTKLTDSEPYVLEIDFV